MHVSFCNLGPEADTLKSRQHLCGLRVPPLEVCAISVPSNAASPSQAGVGTTIASDDKRDWRLRDYMALVAAEETTSQSAVSGLVAGAAVSTAKQILLYPVDTIKVCQMIACS